MEKILILGGAGFIGSNLSKKLADNKKNIVHIVDNFSRRDVKYKIGFNSRAKVKFFRFNIRNSSNLKKIKNDYSYIINLAAIVGVEKVINN